MCRQGCHPTLGSMSSRRRQALQQEAASRWTQVHGDSDRSTCLGKLRPLSQAGINDPEWPTTESRHQCAVLQPSRSTWGLFVCCSCLRCLWAIRWSNHVSKQSGWWLISISGWSSAFCWQAFQSLPTTLCKHLALISLLIDSERPKVFRWFLFVVLPALYFFWVGICIKENPLGVVLSHSQCPNHSLGLTLFLRLQSLYWPLGVHPWVLHSWCSLLSFLKISEDY